jgi:FixJ family two-component response regulator
MFPSAAFTGKDVAGEIKFMQALHNNDFDARGGIIDTAAERSIKTQVLLSAIHQALERSRVALSQEAQSKVLQERYASLSHRERQVLALVVSGLLNKQIGGELGISEITVKAHRGKVMQKTKADSLADLVRMAAKLRPGRFVRLSKQLDGSSADSL